MADVGRHRPLFSVVVPVFNQWALIPGLVENLRRQSIPATAFELIFVDNGSSGFSGFPTKMPNLMVCECATPGAYAARNVGADKADGEWLVFTDADCLPAATWLQEFKDCDLSDPTRALLAGKIEVIPATHHANWFEMYDIVRGIPQERYVAKGYAATANLAVRRDVFEKLGGFDDARLSGGDAEFCRRAVAGGYRLEMTPDALVRHPARSTWGEIAIKARRIKGGQMRRDSPWIYRSWLRTLFPPVIEATRFLADRRHPLRYRAAAVIVLTGIWGVQIFEAFRLTLGGKAERR